jgi:hypothetical protein
MLQRPVDDFSEGGSKSRQRSTHRYEQVAYQNIHACVLAVLLGGFLLPLAAFIPKQRQPPTIIGHVQDGKSV